MTSSPDLFTEVSQLGRFAGHSNPESKFTSQAAILESDTADLVGFNLTRAAIVSGELAVEALLLTTNRGAADLREGNADRLKGKVVWVLIIWLKTSSAYSANMLGPAMDCCIANNSKKITVCSNTLPHCIFEAGGN